jgi:pectinesterase inhibitor-like protein
MLRFSSLIVIFLLCVVSLNATKVVDINTICNDVPDKYNPSFCYNLLKPKQGADLVTLAQYTIDVARNNLTNTVNLLKKLISQSGSDLKAKEYYEYCLSVFGTGNGGALNILADGEQYLKNGVYFKFRGQVNSIIGDYSSCIDGASPSDDPFSDKSLLPKYAKFIIDVAEIMFYITVFLIE